MNKILAFIPLILSIIAPSSPGLPYETIAFSNAGVGGTRDIFISDFTGKPINLTNSLADDILPVWSPDGASIAFLSSAPDRFDDRRYTLHTLDIATREIEQVSSLSLSTEANLDWSPDGQSIAVTLGALFIVNVE